MSRVLGRRIALGAALALAATALVIGRAAMRGRPVPTVRAERGAFTVAVSGEGNLRAVRATPLTTPIDVDDAFKVAWMAPDGSRVKAAEVVVRFDVTPFAEALAASSAAKEIADRRTGKSRSLGAATISALTADAALARRELETARTFQSRDAEIYSRFEIISSEIDATLAERKMQHADAVKGVKTALQGTELDLLAIETRKADFDARKATKALGCVELRAPHDGIVVFRRDWRGNPLRVGESVWPGMKVAEIPALDAMEAEVFVLEADAGGLAAGQRASVIVEGHPEHVIPATVKLVDALAKPRFRGVPVQYFSAVLTLAATDPATMKPGQRVQARLAPVHLPDAISVPRQAVFDVAGKKVVYRTGRWGGFRPVEVTLGPAALGRVVVAGLDAGDEVAVIDPTRAREAPLPGGTAAPAGGARP